MIRIKTQLDNNRVFTLWFMGKWVTLATINGRSSSLDANSLYEAGLNHLSYVKTMVQIHGANNGEDNGR